MCSCPPMMIRDAGRDDRPHDRGRRHDCGGEVARIALLDHARDHDRPDRCRVGQRRAVNAGEEHAAEDRHLREPAAHPADEVAGEADELVGELAAVEELARQHEGREGEQGKGVDGDVELGRHHEIRNARAREEQEDRAGEQEAECDRHAEQKEDEERREQIARDDIHAAIGCLPAAAARRRPGSGRKSRNRPARRV